MDQGDMQGQARIFALPLMSARQSTSPSNDAVERAWSPSSLQQTMTMAFSSRGERGSRTVHSSREGRGLEAARSYREAL